MAGKQKLNEDQQAAFDAIRKFIEHPAANTFVLKGYAGTGKTFLMQYLAKWLDERKYKFSLLASTGRAAAVLRGKTGFTTKTVHSELYQFTRVDGADFDLPDDAPIDQYGQPTLLFSLRPADEGKKIYIVDESSMLSSDSPDDLLTLVFGSGHLLSDFFSLIGGNKIIFVGDPGQLPPVKHIFSPALETDWLAAQRRNAVTLTLHKIERNDPDNDILLLASFVRNLMSAQYLPAYPKLKASNMNCVKVHATDQELLQEYVHKFQKVGADGTIAIARSNRMVNIINGAVRKELFGAGNLVVEKNDVLLVVQNNYAVPLANGDFIIILELGETTMQAGLYFQKAKMKAMLSNAEYEMLISHDILYGNEPNFTRAQSKMLMVDFNRRARRKGILPNSEEYRDAMMKDPYLNCLRVKFGYAVTCHKAQGGEWDEVFLFLEKSMYAMQRQELFRWWYTAITRARKRLHLANNWWIE
jgi:ATP-dependent exoDNAse (exonuclease V) alpha subunit